LFILKLKIIKMESLTNCPNCNTKLKGMMTSTRLLNESEVKFAQDFGDFNGDTLCEKCGKQILKSAKDKYIADNGEIKGFLKNYRSSFPILTLQNPDNWKYEALGMVTSQATMNNVVENNSVFDRVFNINQNLVDLDGSVNIGEGICFEILRQKAYLLGGNAVLGVDIDYSEFGLKGELMLVCMAGTAVRVEGLEEMSEKYASLKIEYQDLEEKLKKLEEHKNHAK